MPFGQQLVEDALNVRVAQVRAFQTVQFAVHTQERRTAGAQMNVRGLVFYRKREQTVEVLFGHLFV